MYLIGLAASAVSDLSRLWCQMRLNSEFINVALRTLSKVNMSTRLGNLDHSVGGRKFIRF